MSRLSSDELSDLTRLVNERLAEFGKLLVMPTLAPGVVRAMCDVLDEWEGEQPLPPLPQPPEHDPVLDAYSIGFERGKLAAERKADDGESHDEAVAKFLNGESAPRIAPLPENPPPKVEEKLTPVLEGNGYHPVAVAVEQEQPAPDASPKPTLSTTKPRTLAEVDAEAAGQKDAEKDEETAAAVTGLRMSKGERAADLRATIYALQDMSVDEVMPSMDEWYKLRPAGMLTAQGVMSRHNVTWSDLARYARLTPKSETKRAAKSAEKRKAKA